MAKRSLTGEVVRFTKRLRETLAQTDNPECEWLRGAATEMEQMDFSKTDPNKQPRVIQAVIENCAKSVCDEKLSEQFNSLYHQLSVIRLKSMSIQNELQQEQH